MKKICFVLVLGFFIPLVKVNANLNTLNGQNGTTQTFANDTNVTMSSSGNVHTLGWTGVLQPSRGGTGTSTVMTQGSILFAGTSGAYLQDNANLFWDDANDQLEVNRLAVNLITGFSFLTLAGADNSEGDGGGVTVYGGGSSFNFGGTATVSGGSSEAGYGGSAVLQSGVGGGSFNGGDVQVIGNAGGPSGTSGTIQIYTYPASHGSDKMAGSVGIIIGESDGSAIGSQISLAAGNGGHDNGEGGALQIAAGHAGGGNANGGNIYMYPGIRSGSGTNGKFIAASNVSEFLGASDSTTTVYIGSNTIPGCLGLGDSDGSGVTYIIVNNGVLTASSTKPINCQ